MLHLKNSVTNKKPKKTMGFSLIELLVVVGIIGILAAVAIPAYNTYRSNAARGALDATITNIARAFNACIAVNTFANCDTRADIGVFCNNCISEGGKTPNYCSGVETEIGGETWKGCVSIDASNSTVTTTYSTQICFLDDGAGTGTANNGMKDGAEATSSPLTQCAATLDCTDALGTGHACNTSGGNTGVCDTSDGTCS